eukprot:gene17611-biopygen12895
MFGLGWRGRGAGMSCSPNRVQQSADPEGDAAQAPGRGGWFGLRLGVGGAARRTRFFIAGMFYLSGRGPDDLSDLPTKKWTGQVGRTRAQEEYSGQSTTRLAQRAGLARSSPPVQKVGGKDVGNRNIQKSVGTGVRSRGVPPIGVRGIGVRGRRRHPPPWGGANLIVVRFLGLFFGNPSG